MTSFQNFKRLRVAFIAIAATMAGCVASQPTVVEKLDERTAVTITHSNTPLILSPDVHYTDALAREYVQIGAIEINRMGSLQYYLWLGIWDLSHVESEDEYPQAFEEIRLVADGQEISLRVHGWSHETIGTSQRSYKKIFPEDADAYYEVTLDQIQMLTEAEDLKVLTTKPVEKEFVPWYNQDRASADLREFVRTVLL